jgi:hypothetical protein
MRALQRSWSQSPTPARRIATPVRRCRFFLLLLLGIMAVCASESSALTVRFDQGSTIKVVTDRSIGGIHPGETSAAITRSYGTGSLHRHPTYRSYVIAHQEVDVEFGSRQRVLTVSSRSPELMLDGQKLENGYGYWRSRLAPQGWRFSRCRGVVSADSPSGHTGLAFKGHVVFAAVIASRGLSAITTQCPVR